MQEPAWPTARWDAVLVLPRRQRATCPVCLLCRRSSRLGQMQLHSQQRQEIPIFNMIAMRRSTSFAPTMLHPP